MFTWFRAMLVMMGVFVCSVVQAQTLEELQAQVDSLRAVQIATISQIKADTLTAQRDSAIVDFGITFYADNVDSQYVQIDFPISTATGYKRALILGSIEECVTDLNARETATPGRLRIRHDKAVRAVSRLNKVLTQ